MTKVYACLQTPYGECEGFHGTIFTSKEKAEEWCNEQNNKEGSRSKMVIKRWYWYWIERKLV